MHPIRDIIHRRLAVPVRLLAALIALDASALQAAAAPAENTLRTVRVQAQSRVDADTGCVARRSDVGTKTETPLTRVPQPKPIQFAVINLLKSVYELTQQQARQHGCQRRATFSSGRG